jgi:hypothetical protein
MLRKRLLWLGKCLLFCVLGIFIAGRLSDILDPPIWWALHKNGIMLLERPSFIASYYLPLIGMYGLLLGLIPIHRLQELLASSIGKFRFRSNLGPEMTLSRPAVWAWVPIGLALVVRLLTFNVRADNSVLGSTVYGEGRYEHFVAPLSLRSTSDLSAWIFDRFMLTGPTLFLFAFSVGVWLRHQFPGRPTGPAKVQQDPPRNSSSLLK